MINFPTILNKCVVQDSCASGLSGADPGIDQGGGPDRDRPKTASLGPQFCRILVLGPHFWWSGGGGPPGPPLDPPLSLLCRSKH